jgi:hypothetical protein
MIGERERERDARGGGPLSYSRAVIGPRSFALSAVGIILTLTACSPFGAEEDDPPETMSASIPAPILTATFEPASADCNGWIAEGAQSIRSVPPRSGSYACKLCADGTSDRISISRQVGPLEAGRYALTAWTRKRPQNAAPAASIATLEASTAAGDVVVQAMTSAVRDEWDRLEAQIEVPAGAASLRVSIGSPLVAGEECVLIDDVTIVALP